MAGRESSRRVLEELQKSDAACDVEVASEHAERLAEIDRVFDRHSPRPPDAVVAIGGGRTIDSAKALRLRWQRPDLSLAALPPLWEPPADPPISLIAIPTTSGSGSENSWSADLRGPDEDPIEVAHRSLAPDWALVDPAFARGMDVSQVVDGGFEALAQSTESYLSAWANPFSDAAALDATATVLSRLAHAVRWSEDPDARAALHYAASCAGLAASNAQRGLAHAIARSLERPTGLRYGRLVGVALPFVLDFDHTGARERLEILGAQGRLRDERQDRSLVERVRHLADQVRFPNTVRAAGGNVERAEAELDRVVAETLRSPASLGNPRVPTDAEVRVLVAAVLGPSAGRSD